MQYESFSPKINQYESNNNYTQKKPHPQTKYTTSKKTNTRNTHSQRNSQFSFVDKFISRFTTVLVGCIGCTIHKNVHSMVITVYHFICCIIFKFGCYYLGALLFGLAVLRMCESKPNRIHFECKSSLTQPPNHTKTNNVHALRRRRRHWCSQSYRFSIQFSARI